ncbi:MAG: hypothetical protein MI724_07340, partial [Spirochaetales bacterium]|nr:hypothetical protein [Spirochaetales bacterium]
MKKLLCIVLALSVSTAPFVFAGGGSEEADDGVVELSLWFHGGTADETEAMRSQIERFNAAQSDYRVVMTEIPGGAVAGSGYNDAVNAAAVADDLPDILDLDGPNLYNYA